MVSLSGHLRALNASNSPLLLEALKYLDSNFEYSSFV